MEKQSCIAGSTKYECVSDFSFYIYVGANVAAGERGAERTNCLRHTTTAKPVLLSAQLSVAQYSHTGTAGRGRVLPLDRRAHS